MPTETVLVQVVTAFHAAGIEQAQASFLKMAGTTLLLTAGIGAMVVVGKSAIENAKAQEEAFDQLTQAYGTQKDTLEAHKAAILAFVEANKAFISDQYDTETAMASVIRAGYKSEEMFRIMNAALDWSAIKHQEVSETATTLIKVFAGNQKALRELGITTAQYHEIMDSTMTTERKRAALLDLIEAKTAKGRDTIDGLAKSQNELNHEWQNFTAKIGPGLLVVWTKLNQAAATGLGLMTLYLEATRKLSVMLGSDLYKGIGSAGGGSPSGYGHGARAAGGPVAAGGAYTVGERGPETLVMGGAGGSIIPSGGGSGGYHVHVHIDRGAFIDGPSIDRLANAILQRARYAPGT